MDELFSLLQIKRHHAEGRFDVVIVDCAPTGETLRLLSFPDVARWWLEKVFPARGALLAAARPIAGALLDVTLPGDAVIADVERLVRNLIAMNEILRDHERVSVRLVMTPTGSSIDEARRTFTYLNLYGYLTDAVIVNRVFPAEVGAYFGGWRERQQQRPRRRRGRVRAGAGAARALLRGGGRRRRRCSTASATRRSPTSTRRRCCTAASDPGARGRRRRRRACGSTCRSPTRATSR